MQTPIGNVRTVAAGAALMLAILLISGSVSASTTTTTTTKQIAVSSLGGHFKVTVTATRASAGDQPTASVEISAFEREAGDWQLVGRRAVGQPNSWFWNVVTGPGAVCRFSTSDVEAHPIEIRLLVSPSIGCSPVTYNFHVDQYGGLVAG